MNAVGQETNREMAEDVEFIQFESEGFVCCVFPHPTSEQVIIEVEVDFIDRRSRDLGVALMELHKLNHSARLTNQIIASVTVDDSLIISKILAAADLSGDTLAAEMALMLDAAAKLKELWAGFIALGARAGREPSDIADPSTQV
jgi:hypothetical protein